ncbi:MAG: hypothetical protein H6605_00235 [Flavobacteriales bacterium]|nr:hypothetical protein [Flavobacteriales bacterium]
MKNLKNAILILIFTFISKFSYGQTVFYGVIDNTTTCTTAVIIYDNGGNAIYSNPTVPPGILNISCTSGIPYSVSITYSSCTLGMNCGGSQAGVSSQCGFSCGNLDNYAFSCSTGVFVACMTASTSILITISP